jgi:hypothetical protein
MSEHFLSLIPEQPDYVPSAEAQARALETFRSFVPKALDVEATVSEHVEFIDQGECFERLLCPACGKKIATAVWHTWMNKSHESQFTDLSMTTPCCGHETDLNSLRYEWPAGFARFVLRADGPGLNGWLPADKQSMLEDILGCKLRQIVTMY